MQTIKHMLKKADDPYLALLACRTTPLHNGFSPSELLMGRKLQTTIPVRSENLTPKWPEFKTVKSFETRNQTETKANYDSHHRARQMPTLHVGDEVWIKDQNKSGKIMSKSQYPRSYNVETSDGKIRRNRRFLRKIPPKNQNQQNDQECFYGEMNEGRRIEACARQGQYRPDTGFYVTRSGRVSKPPARLSLN